jgi:hypothetical protein
MTEMAYKGLHRVPGQDNRSKMSEAILQLRYRRIWVLPPIRKQEQYPQPVLTVLHAQKHGRPCGRVKISWELLINLLVTSRVEAIEKLRMAESLVNLISTFCILSRGILWPTMFNRIVPQAEPVLASTRLKLQLLDRLTKTPRQLPRCNPWPAISRNRRSWVTKDSRSSARQPSHLGKHAPAHGYRAGLFAG